MTSAEITQEIKRHLNRALELKADLHDIDTRRAEVAADLEDEERVVAVLEAVAAAASADEGMTIAPARGRGGAKA